MMTRRILCAGILVRDLVFRIERMPETGKKARASSFDEWAGGNAVNAAIAVARLGGRAAYCGPVGVDADAVLARLSEAGVTSADVVRMPVVITPVSAILIDADGERTVATFRMPDLARGAPADPDRLVASCDALCVDNRLPEFVAPICAAAFRRGLPVVVDVDSAMAGTPDLFRHATHLVFSEQGLEEVTGESDGAQALAQVALQTPAIVGVTRGALGALWRDRDGALHRVPGFAVRSIDTLGAGDVFHGALALALAEGRATHEAMRFASAAAALKCTKSGGAFATPSRAEVDTFLTTNAG